MNLRVLILLSALLIPAMVYAAVSSTATVTITAVGDVLLGYRAMDAKIAAYGVNYAFEHIAEDLRKADITLCNYESCISTAGKAIAKKKFTFRCSPLTIGALKYAGFDVVNIANNHTGDYGKDALKDTLKWLEQENMPYFGAVKKATDKDRGVVLERNGVKVGFLGFSAVYPRQFWFGRNAAALVSSWPEEKIRKKIQELKSRADIVVTSFHWGEENWFYPIPSQIYLAHLAIDSGADVVLGHHPHVMQGTEVYKGKPIIYSLGNFVFFPPKEIGKETIMATLTLSASGKTESIKIEPVYITEGQPAIAGGEKGRSLLEKYYLLSRSIGSEAQVNVYNNSLSVNLHTPAEPEGIVRGYEIIADTKTLKLVRSDGMVKEFKVFPGADYPDKRKNTILFFQGDWDRGYRFDRDGVAPVSKEFAPWFIRFSTQTPAMGINTLSDEAIKAGPPYPGSIGMSKSDIETLRKYINIGMQVTVKTSRVKGQGSRDKVSGSKPKTHKPQKQLPSKK